MQKKYDPTALTILLERIRRMPSGRDAARVHAQMRKLMGGRGRKKGK